VRSFRPGGGAHGRERLARCAQRFASVESTASSSDSGVLIG
jgi:hypothetical protein